MVLRRSVPAAICVLVSCARYASPPDRADDARLAHARDPHSSARPEVARVVHIALDLAPDFQTKTIAGTASLTIESAPAAEEIILDTKQLAIESITDDAGTPLVYRLGEEKPIVGASLTIPLARRARQTIVIGYHTKRDAEAVLWLEPEQTKGKKHPFVFTQGEPILTRTWIPLQDSPGIRVTYEARVTVPDPLRAVMSAGSIDDRGAPPPAGFHTYAFEMKQPIPSYLIALAAGDLEWRSLGPRTGVYADPAAIDEAAREFVDVEAMMSAAEALYGPYRWERYDIVLLPPSFPIGGMENPRLTFTSPSVIAGDRSLMSLVAHELAHSWSGNLVTNATWSDLWLNEGITTYIERRIAERLYGRDFFDMLVVLGRDSLLAEVDEMGEESPATKLRPELADKNPDACFTSIPYEKGSLLLRTIEKRVGRRRLDTFLQRYFERFAFQSMTTEEFLRMVRTELFAHDPATMRRIDLDEWVYAPGVPASLPSLSSRKLDLVWNAVARFVGQGVLPNTAQYGALERIHFLKSLPRSIPQDRLRALDAAMDLTQTRNSELKHEWLLLVIANHYEPALPALEEYLLGQGRRVLVVPLYQALLETRWGTAFATRTYAKARSFYHAVTRTGVEEVFARTSSTSSTTELQPRRDLQGRE